MRVDMPMPWQEFVAHAWKPAEPRAVQLVAHPGGRALSQIDVAPPRDAALAIGPEGGLTDSEIQLAAEHDWQMVDLGPRVLRVETAAVALASALVLPGLIP